MTESFHDPLEHPKVPTIVPADDHAGEEVPFTDSPFSIVRKRFFANRAALVALAILVLIVIFTMSYPLFANYVVHSTYSEPGSISVLPYQGPSAQHWLGTDDISRDEFLRILKGGQISIFVGLAVAAVSTVIGVVIGSYSGFFGGRADRTLMSVVDFFLSLPVIALMLTATKFVPILKGGSVFSVVVILSFFSWMILARVVRGETLTLREREYVHAARMAGASTWRIITRHVLPNIAGVVLVQATLSVAIAIITESTLSFLGFGVSPALTPTWGNMLNSASDVISRSPILFWAPALGIIVTVMCVNFVGDGLRDAFDPKSIRGGQ